MLKKKVLICELLILSIVQVTGQILQPNPMLPALLLHIKMLSFILICSFILSCHPLEQCLLNPLFSLCRFGQIFLHLHLSCLCGWSHSSQLFSQIGITVLQEYKTSPLSATFCVLIESTLFLPLLSLVVACSESRAEDTLCCQWTFFCTPSAQRDSYCMVQEKQ